MIINRNNDYTEYICSLCGHKHVVYEDGNFLNEPFEEYYRKIVTSKPIEIETPQGIKTNYIRREHIGYTCPKCNKLQIDVSELD